MLKSLSAKYSAFMLCSAEICTNFYVHKAKAADPLPSPFAIKDILPISHLPLSVRICTWFSSLSHEHIVCCKHPTLSFRYGRFDASSKTA